MNKKSLLIGFFSIIILLFAGCEGKEKAKELLEASHDTFVYKETDGVNRIAVDENGLLYTITYIIPENTDAEKSPYHSICIYDLTGNLLEQQKIYFGAGSVQAMLIQGNELYCVTSKSRETRKVLALYSIDVSNWKVSEVTELEGFEKISNLELIEEYLYFLGTYKGAMDKTYVLHPEVIAYYYGGEQIGRVNLLEEPDVEVMGIEFPISIYVSLDDTLIIYQYTEERGFTFLEFDPRKDMLTEKGGKNTSTALQKLGGCGDGYLFIKDTYLYYGMVDGMEAQVSSDRIWMIMPAECKKGFAFFIDKEKDGLVERVCIEDIVKENRTICLLMHDDTMDIPYGCGYRMEKEVLASEEYALKVLAQDKDFDAYVLSSRDTSSYNLKENGAFYPLNEVDYVEEYLNACFPYVKEAAYNEYGDVWMIPVGLAIPGLVYNKEYCEKGGIDFTQMDFADFFDFTAEVKQGELADQIAISFLVLKEDMFGQYLKLQESFDTQMFRNYMEQYKNIYQQKNQEWGLKIKANDELLMGESPEFYYMYEVYQYQLSLFAKALGNSDNIGISGVPRMGESVGNVGTITFLAVNPQSDNLKETLEYISSFAQYMLTKQNSFLLRDESMYTNTPFVRDWYRLYADGSVRFGMDTEIYEETFLKYVKGEIELEDAIGEMERRRKLYMGE